MPGPGYLDVLAAIHAILKPRTYLEVGVHTGQTLVLAAATTRALGVDPAPKVKAALGPNAQIYTMKSDDFFAQVDVAEQFGGLPIDLAFIDGMHLFEFALRDFIAVERLCARDSTVMVHDTYPLNRQTAARERGSLFWSGDVWRLIPALKKYRPDLSIQTIATSPTGLTLIRRLDPGSRVLIERRDAIIAEFLALDYETIEAGKPAMLNLVPNGITLTRQLPDQRLPAAS